ncbi:glycosyltransferase [Phenylobacterium sp. LjRoot225]|uniref:glycosyltransferase family 2 protein n=1 Tax=Phenylobacterium sp. LjRoot225 TaxID=3342285 RepID=UPI003ED00468
MRVSIVIPSRNRCSQLVRTVERLRDAVGDDPGVEIIVALNGCRDDSAAAMGRLGPGIAVRTVDLAVGNAASARNAGARAARGALIVFLDDDMDVAPGFVAAHEAAQAARPGAVVLGHAQPCIEGLGWYDQGKRAWWNDHFTRLAQPSCRFTYRELLSGNFSIGRELFLGLGGFDEAFACREDYELGYRLLEQGVPFVFEPRALSLHHDERTHGQGFDRARREGEADVQLAIKHPALFSLSRLGPQSRKFERACALLGERRLWATLSAVLGLLNRLRARSLWLRLDAAARAYAYARGQTASLDPVAIAATPRHDAFPVYDLACGYETVQARLDRERPSAAEFRMGWREVFSIAPQPGAEPLAGRHLPRLLTEHLNAVVRADAASRLPPMLAPAPPPGADTAATVLGELDLEDPRPEMLGVSAASPSRWLVRCGARPLGWVRHQAREGEVTDVRSLVAGQLAAALVQEQLAQRLEGPSSVRLPPISVVICTRDRLSTLRRCLSAVRALDYPNYEIIVVDNAPSTEETAEHVRSLRGVRYVREPTPGLDWARNRGAAAARYAIVAYTDDDTRVDRGWLKGLAEAFAQDEVDVVTGLVAPMKLDTPAQLYFEDVYGGMGKGMSPRWFRGREMSPAALLWASACGVGANMAVRKRTIAKVGPFDPALDVGTATRGGGDIEFFHRVLAAGGTLAYAPSALVWHEHRDDFTRLQGQLRDNGSGFVGYLLTCIERKSVSRAAVLRFILVNWGWRWLLRNLVRPGGHSRGLVLAEIHGAFLGLSRYRVARREAARLAWTRVEAAPAELAHAS